MEQGTDYLLPDIGQLIDGEDDVTQLNRIMADLGGDSNSGAFVSVFRMDKAGRSGEFLDRYEAAEFVDGSLLDTVRTTWGAGKFQFNVYNGTGGLKTRKVVQIAPRKTDAQVTDHRPQQTDGLIVEMLRAMQEQHRATMAGLEMIAAALKTAPAQETETTMLNRMRVMKELFHVEQSPGKDDAARALLEGVKLARELGAGGGGDEPRWLERVMDKLALPAMEMMAANAAKKPVQQREAFPAVSSPAAVIDRSEATNETTGEDENMLAFKLGVKTLHRAARDDEDVNEVAERMLLLLPEEDVQKIVKLPNWFEVMCHHEPGVSVYKAWFERLHAALLQQLENPAGDA